LIFKVNPKSLKKLQKDFLHDVGTDLQAEIKGNFENQKSYYGDAAKTIVFDEIDKVVGSEHWGVAASDVGGEWKWPGKMPNIDNIKEWVRNHFTGCGGESFSTASDKVVSVIAYNIAKKIQDHGLDAEGNYWVDDTILGFVEPPHGANGSGRE